jgi:hypothetical protein
VGVSEDINGVSGSCITAYEGLRHVNQSANRRIDSLRISNSSSLCVLEVVV